MNTLLLIESLLALPWLAALSVTDIRKHELPNKLLLAGFLVALPMALAAGVDYFLYSLVTAFLSSLFLLLPFFLRAAGAGDVKMLFVSGFIAGPGNTLNLILLISFAGNALNFALNLLGCYVHDLRLQCLEYFGKFYEDGGKPFRPLAFNTTYVDIAEK